MNVLLINKTDSEGGAAVACNRLLQALKSVNFDAKLLVQKKIRNDSAIISTTNSELKRKLNFLRFAYERLVFYFQESSPELRFAFSIANTGEDISTHDLVSHSDVLHLHWFNMGYLSILDLEKILTLRKPIVWTLHDMWAFTGGCHYAGGCERYRSECGNCPFLKKPHPKDLTNRLWKQKCEVYQKSDIVFVTCSRWLASVAKKSRLLKGFRIESIPNPIDTNIFCPKDKLEVRKKLNLPENKLLILFASANIFDKRKGLDYLIHALIEMKNQHPETLNNVELILFGKAKQEVNSMLTFKSINLSYLNSESKIADVYSAVDLFVLPSLEDNLPNTVMESLACGTPVVAFKNGGMPEMIDHQKNGYLAKYKSATDLAKGIYQILFQSDRELFSANARKKVMENYTHEIIAKKYIELYKSLK